MNPNLRLTSWETWSFLTEMGKRPVSLLSDDTMDPLAYYQFLGHFGMTYGDGKIDGEKTNILSSMPRDSEEVVRSWGNTRRQRDCSSLPAKLREESFTTCPTTIKAYPDLVLGASSIKQLRAKSTSPKAQGLAILSLPLYRCPFQTAQSGKTGACPFLSLVNVVSWIHSMAMRQLGSIIPDVTYKSLNRTRSPLTVPTMSYFRVSY